MNKYYFILATEQFLAEEEALEDKTSSPLSAAQLAAIALERQSKISKPEANDSDIVDEEDLPDLERFSPKM